VGSRLLHRVPILAKTGGDGCPREAGQINSFVTAQNTGGTLRPHGNSLRVRSTTRRGGQSNAESTFRCNKEA